MLVRKFTPAKLATRPPVRSKKVKSPSLTLTRRTSGAAANLGSRRDDSSLTAIFGGDGSVAGCVTGGVVFVGTDCTCGSIRESGGVLVETACVRTARTLGKRHFPCAFCGQTTLGPISETSLITSRREKRDRKSTRLNSS